MKEKVLKSGALLFSAAIGISILYAASKNNTQQVEQTQEKKIQTEECTRLKMEYENEKKKYDDKYLSTTKSAAPKMSLFELERRWKEKCQPEATDSPDLLNPVEPEKPENR